MLKSPSFIFSTNYKKKQQKIMLQLPNLNINGFTIQREFSKKVLGVQIDGNLTWKDHIYIVENKKYWTLISRKTLPR